MARFIGIQLRRLNGNTVNKIVCWCMLAVILFLLTGCGTDSAFDGSRESSATAFQMSYSVLNREETAVLELTAGDQLRAVLSHTEGSVDVTVGIDGKAPIYRGNGQRNADFVLEIAETGSYRIAVSGHQAKGGVSFTRIPTGQE